MQYTNEIEMTRNSWSNNCLWIAQRIMHLWMCIAFITLLNFQRATCATCELRIRDFANLYVWCNVRHFARFVTRIQFSNIVRTWCACIHFMHVTTSLCDDIDSMWSTSHHYARVVRRVVFVYVSICHVLCNCNVVHVLHACHFTTCDKIDARVDVDICVLCMQRVRACACACWYVARCERLICACIRVCVHDVWMRDKTFCFRV